MMRFFGDVQGWLYGGATTELKGLSIGFDATKLFFAMSIAALFGMVHAFAWSRQDGDRFLLSRAAGRSGSVGTSAWILLTHVGCTCMGPS
jgi:hypothetical protein